MPRLVACALAATLAAVVACSSEPTASFSQKLVILGFDGMDPNLVERWMKEGKLPAFARLAAAGGLHRLETTHSADTAPAWASFATGNNPGKHRIFDAVTRDATTYEPRFALYDREPARRLLGYVPVAPSSSVPRRRATPFWTTAGQAGVRAVVLGVPLTFPPEEVPHGQLLAAVPNTDSTGTIGTYHYFGTNIAASEEGRTDFGGFVRQLSFQSRRAEGELLGPGSTLPFTIIRNPDNDRSISLEIAGRSVDLGERQWSPWIEFDYRTNLLRRVRAIVQFYLASAGPDLRLYASPVQWNAARPLEAISAPARFAADLQDRLGTFRTLGWPAAAWALVDGHLDEAAFMEDAEREFTDRAQMILSQVDARDWDLLVGALDAPDRVQHVMWRLIDATHPMYRPETARAHGGAIEKIYRRADTFVGELLKHLEPETTVLIVSTHGFQPFRTSVHLNSWLVERGYMVLRGARARKRTLHDLSRRGTFWDEVDWARTRAYSVGFGQLFVNLKGREAQGIVTEGTEYEQLLDALVIDLMNFHDERTYDRVVANVYKRTEIYSGPYVSEAADLLVTLEPGFRTSWETVVGGTPPRSLESNTSKWSGDHSSADHRMVAGLLLTNRNIQSKTLRVIDVAPTVLAFFGLDVPADLDGAALNLR